jgi:hypothetical protein
MGMVLTGETPCAFEEVYRGQVTYICAIYSSEGSEGIGAHLKKKDLKKGEEPPMATVIGRERRLL